MPTMLPETAFPKERYPVMATRMYMKPAEPMLETTTPVVRKWEFLAMSLSIENIFERVLLDRDNESWWFDIYLTF